MCAAKNGPSRPPATSDCSNSTTKLVALGYSETSPAEEAQLAAAAAGQDLHRAFAHFEARNLDEAIAALRRVIAATPRNVPAILLLASSLLAKGELQECRALAEQVAADPRLAPYASLLLGMLATSEGSTDEALAHFAEAEKQGGTSNYLLGNVAWAHLRAKRLDEAARLFHSVRELEPDSPLASIGLAVVHAEQGKPAESATKHSMRLAVATSGRRPTPSLESRSSASARSSGRSRRLKRRSPSGPPLWPMDGLR